MLQHGNVIMVSEGNERQLYDLQPDRDSHCTRTDPRRHRKTGTCMERGRLNTEKCTSYKGANL